MFFRHFVGVLVSHYASDAELSTHICRRDGRKALRNPSDLRQTHFRRLANRHRCSAPSGVIGFRMRSDKNPRASQNKQTPGQFPRAGRLKRIFQLRPRQKVGRFFQNMLWGYRQVGNFVVPNMPGCEPKTKCLARSYAPCHPMCPRGAYISNKQKRIS